jgi:PKD repeat protein
VFEFSNDGAGNPVAAFDSFSLTTPNGGGGGGGGPVGPSRDDEFDGTSLDKTRWNAIVRDTPAEYAVSGGKLSITTSAGDVYTGDSNPPPNNFILQSADHAGADWVIETKIDSATINGGYGQGGLLAYSDGANYVKFDAISDAGQTRINRLELRSEIASAIQQPQPADPPIAAGVTEIWLRLSKTGQSYAGEYSLDGVAWTPMSTPVTNPMATPAFGLFAFGPQADGQGDVVPFEYFTLDGADTGECSCVSSGDEFDGTALDKAKWNGIVRDDPTKYTVEGGALKVTTVPGEIYQGGNPTGTGTLFLQTADHAGADYVLETKLSGTINGGYSQGGIIVYGGDDDYVKFNGISDQDNPRINRIELRSEVGGTDGKGQPQADVPVGTTNVWLRLTKTGTSFKGEYSFDGSTWTAMASTVANAAATPKFGLYTAGVNDSGDTVTFDYFAVDGKKGCGGPIEENAAPVLGAVTADPTSGFAPLPVAFTSDATDADGDQLTYSWDFDGNGSADASTKNASHTYAEAGAFGAKVTVSDGTASVSKTVPITVLPADDSGARFRTLVFSKTTGFRHDSIPNGIAAIKALGVANDFQVDATEDSSVFRDGVLSQYDTVVFLSTTGDPLDDAQQAAFERYVKAGGGYTGIHAAADTEYAWPWYGKLVGGYFKSHPPGTPAATVNVEDTDHHSTVGIPTPWQRTDEWYNFQSPVNPSPGGGGADYSPRQTPGVHVLATVDEATYDELDDTPEADDHPISWCQRYDGGRSWYTGRGHTRGSFDEPSFRKHILGGLEVTAGVVEDATCGKQPSTGGLRVDAFADPSSGPAPLLVNFSATGLDPDGDELTYKWEFADGTAFGSSVSRTFRTKGAYTAKVTVSDGDGHSASDEVTVTVGDPESEPPVIVEAGADRTSGPAPLDVLFHAVAEDPEGGPLTYKWEFGDASGGSALGDEAEHTYLSPGTFTAKVTVTDETGQTATKEIVITVANPPGNRAPHVEGAAVPGSGKAPLEVLFTAQGTDPDGDVLTYAWDFDDGSAPVAGKTARHVYTKNGLFTAKVTVTDRGGLTHSAEVTVTVGNPAGGQAPTVQAAGDPVSGTAPLKVNFSAAGSDPDGDSITYVWAFGDGGQAGGTQVTHTYTQPGTYQATVTVSDVGGKTGTATVTVVVSAARQATGEKPAAPQGRSAVRALSVPSLATFRTRGLKVAATCEATGKAAVGLWASKNAAKSLGLKSRGLGRAQFDCTAGKTLQLTLKPSKKVRKAIKAKRPKSLKVTVALAVQDGATVTRTLTLKR